MAIYDANWKSYAMYVTSVVESSSNYGAVESYAMAGIGIMQWTYDRSWQLLNLMVTDYPSVDWNSIMPSVYPQVQVGSSSWGQKIFTQQEGNQVSNALVTDEGVATQNKLWDMDCENMYIPLLRDQCGLTDPKTAIFGLTNHHQAPNAFWQIYNGVGNTTLNNWYTAVLNNGIVGSYTNRQTTVKSLLDEWDGESGKEGFGTADAQTGNGGNQNPNTGNPDDTYKDIDVAVEVKNIRKMGKDMLLTINVSGSEKKILCYHGHNSNYFYPRLTKYSEKDKTPTKPVPNIPAETGTNDDLTWMKDTILGLVGSLAYSQAMTQRTNIPAGYADCSGLVWWLYNQRGYNIGTWTGSQINDGVLIKSGGGGTPCTPDGLQIGDLVMFDWSSDSYTTYGHVELYIGGDEICGHGGNPYMGPVTKSLGGQTSFANVWQVRRIIEI